MGSTVRLYVSGKGVLGAAALTLLMGWAWAQPAYFVQADMVRGGVGAMGAVCVPNSVFVPGEQVVWRAYVFDGANGQLLTPEEVAARGITVYGILGGDARAELAYVPHPPDAPETELYWAGGWVIPEDFALGNYSWSVLVRDAAGNEVSFLPLGHAIGLGDLSVVQAP